MQRGQNKQGFTIVELLIVIVVIGILASITIVAYGGIQSKARDVQTDAAASQIATMLELYRTENNSYPSVCVGGDNSGCNADLLSAALVPTFSNKFPSAYPNPTNAGVYAYVRGTGGSTYALYLRFDSKPDCKRGVDVAPGWWGASLPTC